MRRSLAIAGMAGLVMALAAVLAVRAGLDQPLLSAIRAVDPRVAVSMVIAAVLVQVALFLRVRDEDSRPTAGRSPRAPRSRIGRQFAMANGSVPTIARRTGLSQDVVALALRQTRATAAARPATRQNRPDTATLATNAGSLNGLIRRLTRS